jgi:hypothetical protein
LQLYSSNELETDERNRPPTTHQNHPWQATELSQPTIGLPRLPEQRGEPQQAVPQMESLPEMQKSQATRRWPLQGGPQAQAEPHGRRRRSNVWQVQALVDDEDAETLHPPRRQLVLELEGHQRCDLETRVDNEDASALARGMAANGRSITLDIVGMSPSQGCQVALEKS